MHSRRTILLGIPLLLLLIAVVAFLVMENRPDTPVAISLIGYTNSSSGSKFALFGITNSTRYAIWRLFPGVEQEGDIHIHAPVFSPSLPWMPRTPIKGGDILIIAVGVPNELVKWRVQLTYQERTIPEKIRDFAISHGRPVPWRLGPVTILGEPRYHVAVSSWQTN